MNNEEFQELVLKELKEIKLEQSKTTKQLIKLERRLEEIHSTALEAWVIATENRTLLEKAN